MVADVEFGEALDLVTPQVDAKRHLGGRGKHIDDRAAHGKLAAVLDLVLAPVAHGHQIGGELGLVDLVAGAHQNRLDHIVAGPEALNQRTDGRHDDLGAPLGIAKVPQHPQSSTHGFDAGTHPFERQGLPRRKRCYFVGVEKDPQVVGESVGVGGCGHRDDHRLAVA